MRGSIGMIIKIYLCLNINQWSHFGLDLVNDYNIISAEEKNCFLKKQFPNIF